MTHRFPHDFWAGRDLDLEAELRFDASLPNGMRPGGPYGFSRGGDWESLTAMPPQEEFLRHFIDETALDEMDLDEEPLDEGPHACLVEDLHPRAASTGLFVPEKYEPNYPYPVILWVHDAGGDESELLSLMPRISSRNYFGLSLQGSASVGESPSTGFDWPRDADSISRLESQVYQTLCELRRNFHIHSERVFLAGQGTGATLALRLLLNRPEWFAGAFAVGGELPTFDPQLPMHPELSERRVFLNIPPTADQQHARLWRAAGMNLHTEVEDAAAITGQRLAHLNQWVMETICAPV
jgi:phospholipase/carboxylesterase